MGKDYGSGTVMTPQMTYHLENGDRITAPVVGSAACLGLHSGATATNVVESGGLVIVDSGATVTFAPTTFSDLTLSSANLGSNIIAIHTATVHSGTVANRTTLLAGYHLEVYEGGIANSTTVNYGCVMRVLSGGTANDTDNPLGSLTVSVGGVANRTSGGYVFVHNGGAVNSTTVDYYMLVHAGGEANSTTIKAGEVFVDGEINDTTISGGSMEVFSGAVAKRTDVKNAGRFNISSGGIASSAMVEAGGSMEIFNGGTAKFVHLSGGRMTVSFGGQASNAVVSAGKMYVDGYSLSATVSGGSMEVFSATGAASGGTATATTVKNGGFFFVSPDAVASNTKIGETGRMTVSNGGTANNTSMTGAGAYLGIETGGVANSTTVSNGNMFVSGTANSTTVSKDGKLYISAGGSAVDATVAADGLIAVCNKGEARTVTVKNGGILDVGATGLVTNTFVNSGGSMDVSGSANMTTVKNGGMLDVLAGGAVNGTILSSGGSARISGNATNTTVNQSGADVDAVLTICDGGKATRTTVNVCGYAIVSSGGQVTSTTVNDGEMTLLGGIATSTTVNSGGRLTISNGGTARYSVIYSGGILVVSNGGTATAAILNEGAMYLSGGATVHSADVNSGSILYVDSGAITDRIYECGGYVAVQNGAEANFASNTFNKKVFSRASATVHSGTTARIITLEQLGYLHVFSGGRTVAVTVSSGGNLYLFGGVAEGTTVSAGGSVYVSSGATVAGQTYIEDGAQIRAYDGSILDFDLAHTNLTSALIKPIVNDLTRINGTPIYALTVSASPEYGTYKLAGGAAGFGGTITVKSSSTGEALGTLTVGKTVNIGDCDYSLNLGTDDVLSVTVGEPGPEPVQETKFFTGRFAGGIQSMLAVETDGVVTVYLDEEVFGNGLELDPGWEIAGVGDFNADGRDDFLRVNTEGYVVGEMANENGIFSPQVLNFKGAGWDILGTGDFNGNGSGDVLVANPTGASDTVGLLGYWESGVTWTLINGYSPEWECVSTGDFNGDGKCDMLWRNSFVGDGGLTYNAYCTWIVENAVDWRMVSVANPDEWNFLCSGDFDGNGSHDIAMINDVGVVGIWGVGDGYLNSWSILSAVNTAEWMLAGVGDFNADGTDDIAWCNNSTGLAGYWQINDKQLTTWQNIANLA